MTTLSQVYQQGKQMLQKAGIESPAFDAVCMFRQVFGADRQTLILQGEEPAPEQKVAVYLEKIHQRAQKRPLQYILGCWEFMGMDLAVGEGVLIPREETELLVQKAANYLQEKQQPKVLDLCAGTGAVGLGIVSMLPGAEVICVELYEEALSYLNRNTKKYGQDRVKTIQADVLKGPAIPMAGIDAIVSNPPYVEHNALPGLQAEVRREPVQALDGGADGLRFYRAIAEQWLPLLHPGGIVAVEIGEGQQEAVKKLFQKAGVDQLCVSQDFNGINRVVSGIIKREDKR